MKSKGNCTMTMTTMTTMTAMTAMKAVTKHCKKDDCTGKADGQAQSSFALTYFKTHQSVLVNND